MMSPFDPPPRKGGSTMRRTPLIPVLMALPLIAGMLVHATPAQATYPGPNGTKIVFASNQDGFISAIWLMNADGSNQHRLTDPSLEAFFPDWSPDGTHIIFANNCCLPHSNIFVMNADGTGLRQLTHVPPKYNAAFGSYSPDGTRIVFLGALDQRYTMYANGTHLRRIVADQPGGLSDWGAAP